MSLAPAVLAHDSLRALGIDQVERAVNVLHGEDRQFLLRACGLQLRARHMAPSAVARAVTPRLRTLPERRVVPVARLLTAAVDHVARPLLGSAPTTADLHELEELLVVEFPLPLVKCWVATCAVVDRPRSLPDSTPASSEEEQAVEVAETLAEADVPDRPLSELPAVSGDKVTTRAVEALIELGLAPELAAATARAVVDPTKFARDLKQPMRLRVHGAHLLAVRADVWAPLVCPDPRNPRTSPGRVYPASGRDLTGRVPPLAEPEALGADVPGLLVQARSSDHVRLALAEATDFIQRNNDLRESVSHQGVMVEITLVPTLFRHETDEKDAAAVVSVDGSSRLTAVHGTLDYASQRGIYEHDRAGWGAAVKGLNALTLLPASEVTERDAAKLRVATVPACLIVGFVPDPAAAVDFAAAVRSYVALKHVDPPKAWGAATEQETMGEAVLVELLRRDVIDEQQRDYMAGLLSATECRELALPATPDQRCVDLAFIFVGSRRHDAAVRAGLQGLTTKRRISRKLRAEVAAELVLRSVRGTREDNIELIRKALWPLLNKHVLGAAPRRCDPDELLVAALREAPGGGDSTTELCLLAGYWLVAQRLLKADMGPTGGQPDRADPADVVARMALTERGLRQLHRVIVDGRAGVAARGLSAAGEIEKASGEDFPVNDFWLRRTFPSTTQTEEQGHSGASTPSSTTAFQSPRELLQQRMLDLVQDVGRLEDRIRAIREVEEEEGQPLIEAEGFPKTVCDDVRGRLEGVREALAHFAFTADRIARVRGVQ